MLEYNWYPPRAWSRRPRLQVLTEQNGLSSRTGTATLKWWLVAQVPKFYCVNQFVIQLTGGVNLQKTSIIFLRQKNSPMKTRKQWSLTFLLDRWHQLHDTAARLLENRNWLRSRMRDVVVAVRVHRSGSGQAGAELQGILDVPGRVVVLHCLLGRKGNWLSSE